jgi:hypothetical protein
MSEVIAQQKSLSNEIDSLKLGIVFLNSAFNTLAAELSLTELKMEMDSKQAQGDSMPVKASFKSTFKNGMDAINQIQKEYGFLPFRRVKIEKETTGSVSKFEISMDYKYHIKNI